MHPEFRKTLSPKDKRLINLNNDFNNLIDKISQEFNHITQARKGRAFHKLSTTCKGQLTILNQLDIPAHSFFVPGMQYPILLRHANGVQDDDAATDNRGATIRLLDPATPENYQHSKLDLLLSTGQCFLSKNAHDFHQWSRFNQNQKAAWIEQNPHIGEAAWEMYRTADSYDSLHYYTKTANQFTAVGGEQYFVRFRIIPFNKSVDTGFINANGKLVPPEFIPRKADDKRAKDFLHQHLRAKIDEHGINYLLQAQLRKVTASEHENETALDCTQKWPEEQYPWFDIGQIHLTNIVQNKQIELLSFNPINAPADLAIPLAHSATENASLNHLRSIIYELAAITRGYQPAFKQPLKICVIGAGPSGLAMAYELTKQGHQVTLLEKANQVGGKAQAIQIEGLNYDLGAHVCTQHYQHTAKLTTAFNIEIEPDNPSLIFDIEQVKINTSATSNKILGENILRYRQQRNNTFNGITQPGYYRAESELSQPVQNWLENNQFTTLGQAVAMPFTSSGYGYLTDPSLAILYLLKFAEQGSLSETSTNLPVSWTIKNGFMQLWQKIADFLPDVRCNVDVQFVERGSKQVTVHLANEQLVFDRLVIACPLDASLTFLDATEEEKELFNKIEYYDYYTTVCTIENFPKNGFYLLKQHCENTDYLGHMVAFHHRYPTTNVYCCYSYGASTLDGDDIKKLLQQDVEKMGGEIKTFHTQRKWNYFPHVSHQEIKAGFYNKLEALQGKNNTYYVGSSFNFELIETNLAYINNLIEQHFSTKAEVVTEKPTPNVTENDKQNNLIDTAQYLKELFAKQLNIATKTLNSDTEILALGLDSIKAIEIFRQLEEKFKLNLEPAIFFDYPTINELANYLTQEISTAENNTNNQMSLDSDQTHTAVSEAIIRAHINLGNADITQYLKELFAKQLNIDTQILNNDTEILALGLDSIKAIEIFRQLEEKFKLNLEPAIFFDYPTINELANYLTQEISTAESNTNNQLSRDSNQTHTLVSESIIKANIGLDKVDTNPSYIQFKNYVYAERNGIGLVMDIFVPKANNKMLGVIDVVSALGNSERHVIHNHEEAGLYSGLCSQGFTVFALRPGSHQLFNLEEMLKHVKRGIRFIKSQAQAFGINKDNLALTGGSFGAYLALMAMLTSQNEKEDMDFLQGEYNSHVQAVIGFNPIFDFYHYNTHKQAIAQNTSEDLNKHYFYLRFYDSLMSTNQQNKLSNETIQQWLTKYDLLHNLSGSTPPVRVYQANQDSMVAPIIAERFIHALNTAGGKAELKLVDSDQHAPWKTIRNDIDEVANWLTTIFTCSLKSEDKISTTEEIEFT